MEQTTGAHALEYAGFWRRFAAFTIDVILLSIIVQILFPFRGLGFDLIDFVKQWYFVPLITISNLLSSLAIVAYSVVFWTWRGQTPGKMVMNIKILRGDGSNITIGYALLRYLGYIACFLMLGTGFLWIAFDSRKQGIHDKIADTVVVKLPEPTRTQTALASPRPSAG
jgi:uncharacterized RDD family membrane protein YckC